MKFLGIKLAFGTGILGNPSRHPFSKGRSAFIKAEALQIWGFIP
jgi:hypothetical protein